MMAANHFMWRKITHFAAGALSAWLAWMLPYPQIILVAFLMMTIVLMTEYWRITDQHWKAFIRTIIGPIIRRYEANRLICAAWFLVRAFLATMIPSKTAVVMAFLVWGFADPFGEIFGRGFKGPRIYPGARKRWSGTAGVFLAALIIAVIWFTHRDVPQPWIAAVMVAVGTSAADALSDILRIDDNLSIPIVTALITLVFVST